MSVVVASSSHPIILVPLVSPTFFLLLPPSSCTPSASQSIFMDKEHCPPESEEFVLSRVYVSAFLCGRRRLSEGKKRKRMALVVTKAVDCETPV